MFICSQKYFIVVEIRKDGRTPVLGKNLNQRKKKPHSSYRKMTLMTKIVGESYFKKSSKSPEIEAMTLQTQFGSTKNKSF